jgi:hypothetical protein
MSVFEKGEPVGDGDRSGATVGEMVAVGLAIGASVGVGVGVGVIAEDTESLFEQLASKRTPKSRIGNCFFITHLREWCLPEHGFFVTPV